MSSQKPADAAADGPVPKAVVSRLSLYLRELQHLVRDGHETTSSSELGERLGFSDAQVRKDLAYFGHFGYPGIGYRCAELIEAIRKILGTDRGWAVAMVGTGNLGRALLGYRGFGNQNFRIAAAFDTDPAKVGTAIDGVRSAPSRRAAGNRPAAADQARHDRRAGGPCPECGRQARGGRHRRDRQFRAGDARPAARHVSLVAVDLAIELEQLSFAVANRPAN